MAWVSPKVYAILSQSEEGKDIIEQLPDMTQDECQSALDEFFGEGGKGASQGNDYNQAKFDDEAEEERYKTMGDEEISEKDWTDDIDLTEGKPHEQLGKDALEDVSDDEISEALADYQWQITDSTTVGQYAQETADKLGCSKEQVLKIIRQEDPNISEDEKMAKVAGLEPDDEEKPLEEEKKEPKKLDDLIKERSKATSDKDYDAYSFKKELEENGYKVDYVENRSGTWQDHNGEKFKEYDIKLESGQHIYLKIIADENYDTKELIVYKNGKNW